MNTESIITMARKYRDDGDSSSARIALADAITLYDAGRILAARDRAIGSLAYSVGIHHIDYMRATK